MPVDSSLIKALRELEVVQLTRKTKKRRRVKEKNSLLSNKTLDSIIELST